MYHVSGSVFMRVCSPKTFCCVSRVSHRTIVCAPCASQRIVLCTRGASHGLRFPQLYTRHQTLGMPKVYLPPPNLLCLGRSSHCPVHSSAPYPTRNVVHGPVPAPAIAPALAPAVRGGAGFGSRGCRQPPFRVSGGCGGVNPPPHLDAPGQRRRQFPSSV